MRRTLDSEIKMSVTDIQKPDFLLGKEEQPEYPDWNNILTDSG